MEYPKTHCLYKRDEKAKILRLGEYSRPEFGAIKTWAVEEKIDGMNIRVYVKDGGIESIKGRTEAAELPAKLLAFFDETFKTNLEAYNYKDFVLYGEGFGVGIQSGGIYRDTIGFILFDVFMGRRWSTREEVRRTAFALGLETPPSLGLMDELEVVEFVRSKPKGRYRESSTYIMEGVVARSEPLMRFNDHGNPVQFKLRVKDFKGTSEAADRRALGLEE